MKAKQLKEGLADLAYKAESDHEVQMARAELYKIAKYAIKMHEMLKGVEEREGLEGWVQSKITKAADYMGSVYHHMDYEQKFDEVQEAKQTTEKYNHDRGSKKKKEDVANEGKAKNTKQQAAIAIAKKEKGYKESLAQVLEGKVAEKSKGLYYNVNKRKKAGTSRSKNHPDAPSEKDWKNAAKTAKKESVESKCSECGNPSYTTLPEEKQKGVDGKVCWKGYKRMGTKKKGGKTVDNCVKM
tara:strand:- start:3338 stop:4060 length:723 start_codon:yes stop_codon:yes gene_type:complete